jgi:predicted GIY-YIG superfamily endonuclease
MSYVIYLLVNPNNNCTYIGITNNTVRRIRQHNKELVGGAKYTTSQGKDWKYYGWIQCIEGEIIVNRALSIERKIKIRSRKIKSKLPLDKRLEAIEGLLVENPDLVFVKANTYTNS